MMEKENGLHYIVEKFNEDDFSICITEDPADVNQGCSIRGTKAEILETFEDEEKEWVMRLLEIADRKNQ